MGRYILEGPDAEKVVQENRIRVSRGDVKFIPAGTDADLSGFGSLDSKDAPQADTKKPCAGAGKSTRKKTE